MGKLRGRGWGGLSCADPVNMYVDIITLSTSSVKMDILWEAVHCKTQSFSYHIAIGYFYWQLKSGQFLWKIPTSKTEVKLADG